MTENLERMSKNCWLFWSYYFHDDLWRLMLSKNIHESEIYNNKSFDKEIECLENKRFESLKEAEQGINELISQFNKG